MKESEQRIIRTIGKSRVSNVRVLKAKVLFEVNGWSYEVRFPTDEFIAYIKDLSSKRPTNALERSK